MIIWCVSSNYNFLGVLICLLNEVKWIFGLVVFFDRWGLN